MPYIYIAYRSKVRKWYVVGGILGFMAFISIPTMLIFWGAAIVYSFLLTREYQTRLSVFELVDEETGQVIASWQEAETVQTGSSHQDGGASGGPTAPNGIQLPTIPADGPTPTTHPEIGRIVDF